MAGQLLVALTNELVTDGYTSYVWLVTNMVYLLAVISHQQVIANMVGLPTSW